MNVLHHHVQTVEITSMDIFANVDKVIIEKIIIMHTLYISKIYAYVYISVYTILTIHSTNIAVNYQPNLKQ